MIVMYGSTTCEDTAISRSRLDALGIPYEAHQIDGDPAAREALAQLTDGRIVTPTIDLGDGGALLAEPGLEELGTRLAGAGYTAPAPVARSIGGSLAARPIPLHEIRTAEDAPFSLRPWRGRRAAPLFMSHGAGCLACWGYAKQLARQRDQMALAEAGPVIVVAGAPEEAMTWRHELGDAAILLADAGGAWKAAVAAHLGLDPTQPILLMLDRYGAPTGVSTAAEAGGLVDPSEATGWMRHLAIECPECTEILPWGEP